MLGEEKRIYTYKEYLEISKNDRCEYINNKIHMMGSPSIDIRVFNYHKFL